jgi:hypothetical protein
MENRLQRVYDLEGRCRICHERSGIFCGGCAFRKEMIHLQRLMLTSLECGYCVSRGDAASHVGDVGASPKFWICDTTPDTCPVYI